MRKTSSFMPWVTRTIPNTITYMSKHNTHIEPKYKAITQNQRIYTDALNNENHSLVFGIGPAGCGKTLFACIQAIHSLRANQIRRIIITRPVISVEEDIGFLPGNVLKKMDPWLQPIYDIFLEYFSQRELDHMIISGIIEISPIGFMRGRTFKHSIIIADEMQNSTPNQMMMLLTRLGENSRMIVTGDLKQSDIRTMNGLADFHQKYLKWTTPDNSIKMVFMDAQDVQRSKVVQSILEIYNSSSSSYSPSRSNSNDDAAMIPLSQQSKNFDL